MIYMSMPNSAASHDIDIGDILGQKYRYPIDIGKGDIDPPLVLFVWRVDTRKWVCRLSSRVVFLYFYCVICKYQNNG